MQLYSRNPPCNQRQKRRVPQYDHCTGRLKTSQLGQAKHQSLPWYGWKSYNYSTIPGCREALQQRKGTQIMSTTATFSNLLAHAYSKHVCIQSTNKPSYNKNIYVYNHIYIYNHIYTIHIYKHYQDSISTYMCYMQYHPPKENIGKPHVSISCTLPHKSNRLMERHGVTMVVERLSTAEMVNFWPFSEAEKFINDRSWTSKTSVPTQVGCVKLLSHKYMKYLRSTVSSHSITSLLPGKHHIICKQCPSPAIWTHIDVTGAAQAWRFHCPGHLWRWVGNGGFCSPWIQWIVGTPLTACLT